MSGSLTATLSAASDTGRSQSDGITQSTTPTLTGTAGAGDGLSIGIADSNGEQVASGSATVGSDGTWSYADAMTLADGVYQVMATDSTSGSATSLSVTIDTTAPAMPSGLALTAASDSGFSHTDDVTNVTLPTLTGTAEAGSTVVLQDGGTAIGTATVGSDGTFSVTATTALTEGANTLTVTATDAAGNVSAPSTSLSITLDTTPPAAPVGVALTTASDSGSSQTDDITNVAQPAFTGTAEPGSWVGVIEPGGPGGYTLIAAGYADANGTFTAAPYGSLVEGANTLFAFAIDSAGNTSSASAMLSVTLDTTAPTTPGNLALTPTSDSGSSSTDDLTNVALPTLTGTAEAGSTVTLYDGGFAIGTAVTNGSGTFSVTATIALTQGANSLSVTATDAAGNTSAASGTLAVTLDTTAPVAPTALALTPASDSGSSSTDDITNVSLPTLTGTAEAGSTVTLYDGTTTIGTAVTNGSGSFSVTATTALTEGANNLAVIATDAAGNTSAASDALAVTLDTTTPDTPYTPTLASASDSGYKDDGITNVTMPSVTGTATAGDTLTLYVDGAAAGTTTVAGDGTWSLAITSPLADGIHTISASQSDTAGNVSNQPSPFNLTIDTTPPAMPTGLALAADSDSSSSSTDDLTNVSLPTLTGTGDAGSIIYLYDGGTVIGSAVTGSNGTFSVTPTTALTEGANSLTVTATDAAGNTSGASTSLAVTLDTVVPGMPASLALSPQSDSGAVGDGITNVSLPTLTGTAEAGSTIMLLDGTTVIGTAVTGSNSTFSVTPTTALTEGTNSLTVTATDAAGNISVASGTLTVTLDTTSPVMPTALALATGSDSGSSSTDDITNVSLPTLTGTTEVGSTVTLLDGTTVIGTAVTDSTGSFSVTATTALTEGANALTVTATDAAGNTSAASTSLVITLDIVAPAAPTTLALTAASDSGASSTDDLTNVALPALTGTAEAGSIVTLLNGSAVIGTAVTGSNGTFSVTATTALTEGANSLTVTATDAAGNISVASGTLAVTLDTVAPVAPTGLTLTAASDSGASSTDHLTNVGPPTLTGTAEAGSTVTLLDGTTVIGTAVTGSNGIFSVTATTALSQGANSLTVTATDAAGNISVASGTLAVTLDTVAPGVSASLALSPQSDSGVLGDGITNVSLPTLTGTAEVGSTATLLDGTTVIGTAVTGSTGTFSVTATTALTEGPNSLTVTATDAAGNTSVASGILAITLVDTGPAAPGGLALAVVSDNGIAGDNITNVALPSVTGSAAAGSTVILYDGTSAVGTATASDGGTFSVATTVVLATGSHLLTATATDTAGNVSAASSPLSITLDTTAPAATTLTQTASQGVTGSAEAGSTVLVENGATLLADVTVGANGSWAFLPSTLAAGSYDLSATVEDTAGNLSASSGTLVVTVTAGGSFTLSATDTSGLTTISQYDAHDVLQTGSATIISPVDGHATITASATGNDVINSRGTDTINAGGGTNLVFASGAAATVNGGSGNLIFVAGAGTYVAGGGTGTNTLYGGSGTSMLVGGGASGSILVAGSGNTSLQGGAGSAALMFGGSGGTSFSGSAGGSDTMVGGSGTNSFALTNGAIAFGGPNGADTYATGTGSSLIVEGNGTEQVTFGGGSATVFDGAGTDLYTVARGVGGSADIIGFKAGDHITLTGGFTAADASSALATATHGAFGTSLTLSDGTSITLFGTTLTASQVGVT